MKNDLDVFKKIRIIKTLKNLINLFISLFISKLSSEILILLVQMEQKVLIEITIFILSLLSINLIVENYFDYLLFNKELKANNKLKIIIYNKLYSLSISNVENLGDGQLKELLNDDLNIIENYLKIDLSNIINGIISTLVIGIYIFLYSSIGIYILCIIALLQLIPTFIVKKYLIINYNEMRLIESELSETYIELYKGLDVIKNHKLYNWFNKIILDKYKKYTKIGVKTEAISQIEESLNQLAKILVEVLTYVIVGIFIYIGKIDFEIGVQVIILSSNFYNSINLIFNGIRNKILFLNSYNRINEKFYISNNLKIKNDNIDNMMQECIELKNVCFGYDNVILENINLNILDKEKIIILGKNGQGKTTLFKLMLKIYTPNKGIINWKYNENKIGWLPQMDYNFTICGIELIKKMNNKRFIDINMTIDILNKFNLEKESLENIPISRLSGGEKKKIFLAITLSSFTNVIFLDEPTNQLDISSKKILKNILKESNKTIIMITHDLELLDLADKIFNIHNKKIQLIKGDNLL